MKTSDDELTVVPLPLTRIAVNQPEITLEEVSRIADIVVKTSNRWDAFKAAISRAGLTEEEVRDALGISAPHWSVFGKPQGAAGAKHFDHRRQREFNRIVGNSLVTQVDAYLEGFECRPLLTELEKRVIEAEAREKAMQEKYEHALEVLKAVGK